MLDCCCYDYYYYYYYYYYIRLTAFFVIIWVSRHHKGKPFWILLKQEMMGGSGIRWIICKSVAPHSRQITTPVPHHSVFTGRMPFLSPNQQRQSTEVLKLDYNEINIKFTTQNRSDKNNKHLY